MRTQPLSALGIAKDLMTGHDTTGPVQVERLVLVDANGRTLGTWRLQALTRRLKQHFRGELPCDDELAGLNEDEATA